MAIRISVIIFQTLCVMGMVSCDSIERLLFKVGEGEGEIVGERKKGLDYVKLSNPEEIQKWKRESNVLVITDYIEEGSEACENTTLNLKRIANKYGDKVAILQINVSNSKKLLNYAKSRGIKHYPSMEVYLNGKQLDTVLGELAHASLEEIVTDYLEEIPDNLRARDEFEQEMLTKKYVGELPNGVERVKIPANQSVITGKDKLPKAIIESPN